ISICRDFLSSTQSSHQKPKFRERREMRLFDPWPVFFKREWKRCWPFLTGFAVTGVLITKLTAGFTEEDAKNSKFVQQHRR
ncbi:unnamed protein product, partial [Brassica rapa]